MTNNPKQKIHGPRVVKKMLAEAEKYVEAAGILVGREKRTSKDYIYALNALDVAIIAYEIAAYNPQFKKAAEQQIARLKTARINTEADWRDDMRYNMRVEYHETIFGGVETKEEKLLDQLEILVEEMGLAARQGRFGTAAWIKRKKEQIEKLLEESGIATQSE
jgi:hypothetical protein